MPTIYSTLRRVTEICAADLSGDELSALHTLLDTVESSVDRYIAAAKEGEVAR